MPDWNRYVRDHLSLPELTREREEEILEDLVHQFEQAYRDALASGADPEVAARQARQHIPDWDSFVSDVYRSERRNARSRLDTWQEKAEAAAQPTIQETNPLAGILNELRQDALFGLRTLRNSPGFTAVAALSLGLGIAVITTVFSLTNAYFLRPLPFPEPDALVHVWQTDPNQGWDTLRVAVPNYLDLLEQSTTVENMGGYFYSQLKLGEGRSTRTVEVAWMTPSLLDLLGVPPLLGRSFTEQDASAGRDKVVILSERFWSREFNRDPGALGRSLRLDDEFYTVIGVMPESFVFPFNSNQLWMPLDISPYRNRRAANGPLLVVGRLAKGSTLPDAQTELSGIMARLRKAYPVENARKDVYLVPVREALLFTYEIFRVAFPALLLAVGFVLLIVCSNLGNLLLARASGRAREVAVRLSLGATRGRIIRQLLTESLLLAVLGGVLGIGLASRLTAGFNQNIPGELYRVGSIDLDWVALAFALAVCVGTALLFGLAPALQASRVNLNESLKGGARGFSGTVQSRRLRTALVVTQIGLAVLLVYGSTLMMQTFLAFQRVDTVFNPDNLLTMEILLPDTKYSSDTEENLFYEELLGRVRSLPGVQSATAGYPLQLNHETLGDNFEIEGRPPAPDERYFTNVFWITTDYFSTLQVPLLRGRDFQSTDTVDSEKIVLINQALEKRYFPGQDPLGQRIKWGSDYWKVTGIVADSVAYELNDQVPPIIYLPQQQASRRRRFLLVRTEGDPMLLAPMLRQEVRNVDPDQPVSTLRTMDQVILTWMGPWLLGIGGIGSLGVFALLLASMGIYGVVAYTVVQRTQEFGVRMALGASRVDVFRLVLGRGLFLAGMGVGLGLVASLGLTALLKAGESVQVMLFGVSLLNSTALVAAPLVLCLVALIACYWPARRAAGLDPMVALRYE